MWVVQNFDTKSSKYYFIDNFVLHICNLNRFCDSRQIFTLLILPAASSPFCIQWLDNFKYIISVQFDPNIPCGSRVMKIFTDHDYPD